jgi:YHS domain-containing protein/uncharacterized membrane protein YraQ (UPF0718 family)
VPHLLALTVGGFFDDIGRSLKEGFFMFWETLWALVLGFGLSGAVQAFVSRETMQRTLGNHRPAAIGRASFFGMVSSSCSYAASAMAKSLFAKGADFVASMVFMFASTNLVIELGIVLVVLIGWQFMAAEFVGGVIMIVLLVLVGGLYFRGGALEEARRRVEEKTGASHDHHAHEQDEAVEHQPTGTRIRSLSGWSDAAGYTMADLTMLRREMFIGYGVAGFLAMLVPVHVWNDVFIHGHGFATTLENVVVGPFIALISYVCSIGNVPLAAALWKGGISFGGVVSFIFADLIAFPLLLIYRKFYGTRMTLRMLTVFWSVMSVAGLATEGIFRAAGLVPTTRPRQIVADHFSWNYTSYLDIVFLILFAVLYLLYSNRGRFGGGAGYAIDPVCGMQVETAHAPTSLVREGRVVYFCSDHCRDRFTANPARFTNSPSAPARDRHARTIDPQPEEVQMTPMAHAVDPVCKMTVDTETAAMRTYEGVPYYFCNPRCAEAFDADPKRYAVPAKGSSA